MVDSGRFGTAVSSVSAQVSLVVWAPGYLAEVQVAQGRVWMRQGVVDLSVALAAPLSESWDGEGSA